jgi:hypothetical protein
LNEPDKEKDANPLGMRGISPAGFILPPQICSERRREYFLRANRILGTYATITAYCGTGEANVKRSIEQNKINDETEIRIRMGPYIFQSKYRLLKKVFGKAGAQFTNQVFLMVYGNFEAYLADLVRDSFAAQGEVDPLEKAISLMSSTRWEAKIDRISKKRGVQLRKRDFIAAYKAIDMAFMGKPYSDPIEFLQSMADLRHRFVHSAGRVDKSLLRNYPSLGLPEGTLIELPFGLPYEVNLFFVPMTELLDKAFCEKFGWARHTLTPEHLTDI